MVERRRSRRRTAGRTPHRGMRTCVGCRKRADRSELLRVAAIAVGGRWSAVPNERGRYPGRGAWLHHAPTCLDKAVQRRGLHRALPVPADVVLDVEALRARSDGLDRPERRETTSRPVRHADTES